MWQVVRHTDRHITNRVAVLGSKWHLFYWGFSPEHPWTALRWHHEPWIYSALCLRVTKCRQPTGWSRPSIDTPCSVETPVQNWNNNITKTKLMDGTHNAPILQTINDLQNDQCRILQNKYWGLCWVALTFTKWPWVTFVWKSIRLP
jgi:hypothetical protein